MVAARRLAAACVAACAALTVLAGSASAAPADLDRSFGNGGITEVAGPAGELPREAGGRMAIGPHDEIFVLYSSYPPCDPPFECHVELTVARYTPDGQPDPSFAAGPQLAVTQNAFTHYFELAVGPDGKPVIAAYGGGADGGLVIARLGLDGHLDPSFGVGGITGFTGDHAVEVARDYPKLAVQADDKIVVAVEGGRDESGATLAVARYLPNGEFDPSFGSGGEVSVPLSTRTRPADLFVGADGKVTVPGPLCCLGGTPLFGEGFDVTRLLVGGQPDPSWAGDGNLFFATPGAQGFVEAATPAPDGGLYVSYEAKTPTVSTVGNLIKLTSNGALDPSFGSGGAIRLYSRVGSVDPRAGSVDPKDLAVDAQGRLVGVGWAGRIAVFRLRPDGGKDRTFNGGERLVVPYGGGGTPEYSVGIQSNGRIIAFGESGLGATKRFGLIALRGGTDHSRCLGKKATIVGTAGRDELIGTPHRDVIAALGGADEVRGLGGPDLICGGKGKDRLFGGAGKDEVLQDPRRRK